MDPTLDVERGVVPCCVNKRGRGTLGGVGETLGGVGPWAPVGGLLMLVWGTLVVPFPPHGWSAPGGPHPVLCKQPAWAAGDTPYLMPVEQGLPRM